jgi:hypothetical protein
VFPTVRAPFTLYSRRPEGDSWEAPSREKDYKGIRSSLNFALLAVQVRDLKKDSTRTGCEKIATEHGFDGNASWIRGHTATTSGSHVKALSSLRRTL